MEGGHAGTADGTGGIRGDGRMIELMGLLENMKMEHLRASLDSLCEQASKRQLSYREPLTEALRAEWQVRRLKGMEMRL